MKVSLDDLEREYHSLRVIAERFLASLTDQIEHMLLNNGVALGVPVEYRVKSWESICQKIERRNLQPDNIKELNDLIGLRLMLLFMRDVKKTNELITQTFNVVEQEDTIQRLREDQFGYQSFHVIVKMPQEWLRVPSLRDFAAFRAEIQIRTLSQHIWAAASHVLQYKHKASVPQPVRRSIHRVSALLETVDLEFERALQDREGYIEQTKIADNREKLNVDLLSSLLDKMLLAQNKSKHEDYSELLVDLRHFNIEKVSALKELLSSFLDAVLAKDVKLVKKSKERGDINKTKDRCEKGVFFSHTGLTRSALEMKIGLETWTKYLTQRKYVSVP